MKSHQKSHCQPILVLSMFWLIWLLACSHSERSDKILKNSRSSFNSSQEISLKEDREHLEELRKEIPDSLQDENDELAGILKFTSKMGEPPNKIRDRFEKTLRLMRKNFDEQQRRDRVRFDREEKEKRRAFLDEQKRKRMQFVEGKHSHEESRNFFSNQEEENRVFFSIQQEERRNFESEITSKRNEKQAYFTEKSNEFNQELKSYNQKYYDWINAQKMKEKMEFKKESLTQKPNEQNYFKQKEREEFDKVPDSKGITLTPEDEK